MPMLTDDDNKGYPTVSVVMPVYQVVDYVDEAISSVLGQTYADFELIIVDDGSTDGSGEKCDVWASRDSRVIVLHQQNAGQSSARNLGISKARGKYLLFVDSDDYVRPSLLSSSLERLIATKSDICFFKYVVLKKDGTLVPYKESASFPKVLSCSPVETLEYLLGQRLHHYPWVRLAKTELYAEGVDFFPVGRKMEDMATTPRLITHAKRVSFLDEELYVYRMRDGSTLDEWPPQLTIDTVSALADIETDVRRFDSAVQNAAFNYSAKMLFYIMMMECSREGYGADEVAYELAKYEMSRVVVDCGWKNLTLANKLKFMLMKLGLTGFVAKARRG